MKLDDENGSHYFSLTKRDRVSLSIGNMVKKKHVITALATLIACVGVTTAQNQDERIKLLEREEEILRRKRDAIDATDESLKGLIKRNDQIN